MILTLRLYTLPVNAIRREEYATLILTPNKKSPYRCVLDLEATGPSDPDPMPSNNVTRQTIDIIDGNDL